MAAYYNEIDPYCAQWLRNLIAAGHIAPGDVDDRSIKDVGADDLRRYTQCHFFAGIGGWSYALRIAGVPDDLPIWTASPPCQDVSLAGSSWGVRSGLSGARSSLVHVWLDLVIRLRPRQIYFENVPGVTKWLPEIERRLAGAGYRVSKSKRSVASVAGPHLRQRVFIAADRDGEGLEKSWTTQPSESQEFDSWGTAPGDVWVAAPGRAVGMADGFPNRVAAIRAFGNAICPRVAADFILGR